MLRFPWRSAGLIFVLCAVVTGVFLINLCDLIYDCGCRAWWAGAADLCNIHDPGAHHCPWCSVGFLGFLAIYLGIVLPQGVLSLYPRRWSWPRRLLAALLAFPAAGVTIGLAMGWWMGYWS